MVINLSCFYYGSRVDILVISLVLKFGILRLGSWIAKVFTFAILIYVAHFWACLVWGLFFFFSNSSHDSDFYVDVERPWICVLGLLALSRSDRFGLGLGVELHTLFLTWYGSCSFRVRELEVDDLFCDHFLKWGIGCSLHR